MRTKALLRMGWAALLLVALVTTAFAQDDRGEGKLDPAPPKGITPEQIIQRFAAKEKEFKTAREQYTYRQSVKVQTVDGDTVDGEYQQVSDILFDTNGRRITQVVFAPQSSLQRISMSKEDFSDIETLMPFVLTTDEIPEYDILYAGQQKEDELNTYVFDLAPKKIEKDKRYFQGRIWVDDHDFQVVKTHGRPVPEVRAKKDKDQENLFPKFTTWREQIDGQYWFPTFTRADDTLQFKSGDVHIREIIKYTNYKRFGANTVITYEGKQVPKAGDKPADTKKPPQ